MEKNSKLLAICLFFILAVFSLNSCISRTDELDLDKEISYDMHIAPDGFSIPIGNLDRIYIDSLIKTNEDGSALVILPNGEYGIKTDGQINRVNINIADVTIEIDDPQINPLVVNFEEVLPNPPAIPERSVAYFENFRVGDPLSSYKTTKLHEETVFPIDADIDDAIKAIKKMELKSPAGIDVKFKFSGVPESVTGLQLIDFIITFPDFFKISYSGTDTRISSVGNTLKINGTLNSDELSEQGAGFVIPGIAIEVIEFNPVLNTANGRFVIEDCKIILDGTAKIDNQLVPIEDLNKIRITPTVSFDPIMGKTFTGTLDPEIDAMDESVEISLSDDADFLKENSNQLILHDPQLTLNISSSLSIPVKLDLSLSSKDKEGNFIAKDIIPDDGSIDIPACPPGAERHDITLVIQKNKRTGPVLGDTVFVSISRLSELMATIPDSVIFNLKARTDLSADHRLTLGSDLYISGDYQVVVPLAFDNVFIEYSDTISELGKDLEDISESVNEVKLELKARVTSTIPLGANMLVKALDREGKAISDIVVEPVTIGVGSDAGTTSDMIISITVKKGALNKLDALVLTLQCTSEGNAAKIKKGQYIELSDMKLLIPEGIKVDFTDQINDDDN